MSETKQPSNSLTWKEAKDQVAKAHESDMILMPAETYYKEAAELYASSCVRTLEEQIEKLKLEVRDENVRGKFWLKQRNELKEKNKRLQERARGCGER